MKTIMYEGVRCSYRSTTRNNGLDYDVTNDWFLIGYMVAQRHGQLSRDRGNRSFWHNALRTIRLLSALDTYCRSRETFIALWLYMSSYSLVTFNIRDIYIYIQYTYFLVYFYNNFLNCQWYKLWLKLLLYIALNLFYKNVQFLNRVIIRV